MGFDIARLSVLAITAVAVIAIQEAQAVDTSNNAAQAEGVTVTGEGTGSLTSVSPEESAKQKRQVPGAFTVKTARNLTNQRYASSIDVIANARTEPNPEIFNPGDGRSFYGGVS
jgi:hypothetical protein